MIRPLGNDTITIVKPTVTVDPSDNTTILGFSPPDEEIVVPRCMVQPYVAAQVEDVINRDFVRATWRVWAPITDDVLSIEPHDRIVFQEQEYEIFGVVGTWRFFSGTQRHAQFTIQLRKG